MGNPLSNDTYNRWLTVTPSDTVDLDGYTHSTRTDKAVPCDCLWVSVSGTLSATLQDGSSIAFPVTGVGYIRVRAIRVNAAGTAATGILALYQV